jgi:hypothetical protein
MSLVVTTADLHKRAGSGARPFEGANISTSEKHAGAMYEFMREFAALEPQPPELQQPFGRFTATRRPWMDLEIIAAIFAAAAKRHTVLLLLLRVSSQSTSEAVLN